jgi:hypothetical protein
MANIFLLRKAEVLLKWSFDFIILIFLTHMLHCFKKELGDRSKPRLKYIFIREADYQHSTCTLHTVYFLLKFLFYYSNNMQCVGSIASALQAIVRSLCNEEVKHTAKD